MECKGVDFFVIYDGYPPVPKEVGPLKLELVSNRGTKIPETGDPGFLLVDWHRARYIADHQVGDEEIATLMTEVTKVCEWEKIQKLYFEGDERLFSKAHS